MSNPSPDQIPPGESLSGFRITSPFSPGQARTYVQGYAPVPFIKEPFGGDEEFIVPHDTTNSQRGFTIGPSGPIRPCVLPFSAFELHNVWDRPNRVGKGVVESKVVLKERPEPIGERDYPELGAFSVGTALALDPNGSLLPLDLAAEAGELRDPKAGLEKAPNAELFLGALGGIEEPVGFLD